MHRYFFSQPLTNYYTQCFIKIIVDRSICLYWIIYIFFFAPTSTRFFNDVDDVCLRMLLLLVVRKGSHRDYFRSWCSLLFIFNKNKFNWKPIKSCRLNRFMFGLCQAGGIKFHILNPLFNSTCHGVSPEMKLSFRKSFYSFFILFIHLYFVQF